MKPGLPGHMEERGQRIAWLVSRYIRKEITVAEHNELDEWINESDENMRLFEEWTNEKNIKANLEWMDSVNAAKSYDALKAKGAFKSAQKTWIWTAACVLIVLSAVFLYRSKNIPVKNHSLLSQNNETPSPGYYRASLEIGNNFLIDLESAPIGKMNNGIEKKQEGLIVYNAASTSLPPAQHIIRTPVGGQYQVLLNDGTQIWMNASSKLSYSTHFNDTLRSIELTGEAYFEVAKDSTRPFIVQLSQHRSVKVLGTDFNISSYQADPQTTVSLTEGSVLINTIRNIMELRPGEQAILESERISMLPIPDSNSVLGWKNGIFSFYQTDLPTIFREVERWYGVKFSYRFETKEVFSASISRQEKLEDLLDLLEKNAGVRFRMENKTIYVEKK